MSRTTRNINYITKELDRISGLDGIVADKTEKLAIEVHEMVEDILDNHCCWMSNRERDVPADY